MSLSSVRVRELTREEVRRLYRERMKDDFPKNELKPLSMMEAAMDRGDYLTLGAFPPDQTDPAAYAFFVTPGDAALFDYLAVRQDLRDCGVGSAFLRALGPTLARFRPVLLESDDPDHAPDEGERTRRLRRLAFYERNGLIDTGVRGCVFGADFRILVFPSPSDAPIPEPEDTARLYRGLYRTFLPEPVLNRAVRISYNEA